MVARLLFASVFLLLACERRSPANAACGVAALAGPTALLTQFSVPNQTLSAPPSGLPERLVTRVVAGPALSSVVGRADSLVVIGVEGSLPQGIKPGFGALVVDLQGKARGVMMYEGKPVEGAPQIGKVNIGDTTIPLIGIQLDPNKIEDRRCPFFPDSILR
jgi:hypothetical protein